MKRIFVIFCLPIVLIYLLILLGGCSNNQIEDTSTDLLLLPNVLNNNATFIAENGVNTYLKDYVIETGISSTPIPAIPSQYTYVDMDGDGENELIVLINDRFGCYLVFHCNNQNVFGYEFSDRSLLSLKTDGSFMASNGAASNYYCKMTFNDDSYIINYEAIVDDLTQKLEINGENVSMESFNKFVADWNLKADVRWYYITTNQETTIDDTTNEDISPINLNDYVSVYYSGKNLAGYAHVSFDKEKFLLDNINNISFNSKNLQVYRELYGNSGKSAANEILRYIDVNTNKTHKLSNDDVIETVWNINTERLTTYFELDYICSPQTFIVSGLEEADTYDPFEDFKIEFSGIAPYGNAKIYTYDRYGGEFSISKSERISNGDIILATYSCDSIQEMIEDHGTYPSCYEKTFVVSGLKEYPQSINDFSSETLSSINNVANNYFEKLSQNTMSHWLVVEDYNVEGYAFIAPTVNQKWENSEFYVVFNVIAKVIYKEQIQSVQYYVLFEYKNPIIDNGICTMDTTNYSVSNNPTVRVPFSDENNTRYIIINGFNTKEEITQYLSRYIGNYNDLVFQTYQ